MAYVAQDLTGVTVGVLVRVLLMVRERGRPFPTYPHGQVVHLFLGFVAAVLGALALPALASGNYTAGVFLGLGASQFHAVRGLESAALRQYDREEAVPRGRVYAEGLALAFEARNFLLFGISLAASGLGMVLGWWQGGVVALVAGLAVAALVRPARLGDICQVTVEDGPFPPIPPSVEPAPLRVRYRPRDPYAQAVLRSPAQRQAILHHLHAGLGSRLRNAQGDMDTPRPAYTPEGELVVELWPVLPFGPRVLQVAADVPVLESIAAPLRVGGSRRR
jgi:hypothetical protein